MYFKKATIKKLFKDAGASRVSNKALLLFQDMIEKQAYKTAVKSVNLSKHAKRKTVEESDIKLAASSD
ncbi:histone family protein [Candidatus Mancarchaeum acidiphilum]|uniref:histone family protein n=1 Tax=Candidatus Mancarchaeum acidiphilum TaxID=1920749 RepID=UPI0012FF883A|nr:histone [Candidatus Mancarchaeum acidiphilum]